MNTLAKQGVRPKDAFARALMERAARVSKARTRIAMMDAQRAAREAEWLKSQPVNAIAAATSLVLDQGSPYHDLTKPSRYKIYYGGRDSAKSWAMAEALIRRAAVSPITILCTREFQSSISDSVHKLLKNTITRLGLDALFDVTEKHIRSNVGAVFIFKGLHHNTQEIKSTEGVDICWVEEAHNTSEESWTILIPTIRKAGSEIWMSFNVSDEEAPTHIRFVTNTPPNSIKHFVNYDSNPYLSPESIREIDYLKALDYDAFEHVYLGRALKISDAVVFAGKYREMAFPDEYERLAERHFYGADFGYAADPSTLIHSFMHQNNLYVAHEAYGHKIELNDYDQFYKSVPGSDKWPIKGDNARPETISHIRGFAYNITAAEKWQGSVEDGITHLRSFKEIIIHPRCKHTLMEMRLYSYKKDKITGEVLPVIIDKHNHCIDAMRYSLDGYIQRRGALSIWAKLAGKL